MTFDLRRTIYQVTSETRKLCFDIRRNGLCGPQVLNTANLSLDIYREGAEDVDDLILTYEFFDKTDDGRLCVLLDSQLVQECPGRYIAYLMYGCEQFDYMRFEIGCRPVVASAPEIVSSNADDCLPDLGELSSCMELVEPEQCCDEKTSTTEEPCCPQPRCDRVVELCPDE